MSRDRTGGAITLSGDPHPALFHIIFLPSMREQLRSPEPLRNQCFMGLTLRKCSFQEGLIDMTDCPRLRSQQGRFLQSAGAVLGHPAD